MIYASSVGSLIVQFIVGIIDFLALNTEVKSKDEFVKDLLRVELVVQVIEFAFYLFLLCNFSSLSNNISLYRYLDWSFTTPLMLITLSGFLNHDSKKPTRLTDFLSNNAVSILKIVILNAAMLLCGVVGELGYLSPYLTSAIGFIPFFLNFKHIKDSFLRHSEEKIKYVVFYWFVFFWSLYGVFAVMNHTYKNTGYNILDIFSKNFFGIFLAYLIESIKKDI